MKIKMLVTVLSLALCLSYVSVCFADDTLLQGVASQGGYETRGVTETTLSQTVGSIVQIVLSLIGTIFFILTVYAGFLWMTAGGNEENVEKATKILKYAVIGLIITLAAYSITFFVFKGVFQATGPAAVGG